MPSIQLRIRSRALIISSVTNPELDPDDEPTPEEKPAQNDDGDRFSFIKKKMQPTSIIKERRSSIHNAFASALAWVGEFDEDAFNRAFEVFGQYPPARLRCVYCGVLATDADHLHGLVQATQYSGHGHVIGNLVPACKPCNNSKQNRPWHTWGTDSKWARTRGPLTAARRAQLEQYEALAPEPVGHDRLMNLYPKQMTEYQRLKQVCLEAMQKADEIAEEIQELEKQRRNGEGDAGVVNADRPM